MKNTPLIIVLISILAILLFSCKSPTDIGGNIIEIPTATTPVLLKDLWTSVNGGGKTIKLMQNRPSENVEWNFDSFVFENISIDTTNATFIKLSFDAKAIKKLDNISDYEGALPTELKIEVDSLLIPIDHPAIVTPIPLYRNYSLNKALLKAKVFTRVKDGGGYRFEIKEIEFPLLEGDNFAKLLVSSIKFPGVSKNNKKNGLKMECNFFIPEIAIDSDFKKDKVFIRGGLSIEIEY